MQFFHFNSRPHEEIDPASNVTAGTYLAFQLTISRGGRPDSRAFYTVAICISTHDLARRSTLRPFFHALPATFQLTTSRGGRLYTTAQPLHQNPVSTHDLTRRSTLKGLFNAVYETVFQLTTSRGGRQLLLKNGCHLEVFQLTTSQGGRHLLAVALKMSALYFNSRPRKEVDRMYFFEKKTYEHFNSRPREEVDSFL